MMDHMDLEWEPSAPFAYLAPETAGVEDCESLSSRLKRRRMVDEKYFPRHLPPTQRAAQTETLPNVFRPLAPEAPADGPTKTKRDSVPLLSLLFAATLREGREIPKIRNY